MKDEYVLYIATIMTFLSIIFTYRINKSFFVVNIIAFILYSIYFYYGLKYQSTEGRALGWLLSNLFFTGLHFFGIIGYVIFKYFKK